MLEIFAIIYLAGKNGGLAERKGYKKGLWKLYTVLAWLGGEFVGILLGIILFGQEKIIAAVLLGYAIALATYFIIKETLLKRPDVTDDNAFDFEQNR